LLQLTQRPGVFMGACPASLLVGSILCCRQMPVVGFTMAAGRCSVRA
jgi:hypothetical protein